MPKRRRRPAPMEGKADAGRETKMIKVEEEGIVVSDVSGLDMEKEVRRLRERWELASVLNFLCVFEPIMEKDPKISAEEVEIGLIRPNSSLAQLHVKLLKGILPLSKTLDSSDTWVTILCKKLYPWWPWVAQGEIPLRAANGEEISKYKELDPIERLSILKALCELRVEQDDAVSYVNNALKDGKQICCFRKEKVADDGNETSYWYEGNAVIGHRLYRARVRSTLPEKFKLKMERGQTGRLGLPATSFQWETLATNLDEFCQVADELASSKESAKIAISGIIESDMILVLQRLKKKKEKAIQRERQKVLLNSCGGSYASLSFRSRRSRRLISYTFDDYDLAINEAIQVTETRKISEECREQSKQSELQIEDSVSTGESNEDINSSSKDHSPSSKILIDECKLPEADDNHDDDDDGKDGEYDGMEEEESKTILHFHKSDEENDSLGNRQKARGVRWSKRLAGVTDQTAAETIKAKTMNLVRQRLLRNSALDSIVVPDSDDEEN